MTSRMFDPATPDLQTILPPPLWQRVLAAYPVGSESRIAPFVSEGFNDPSAKDLAELLLYRRNQVTAARIEPELKRDGPCSPVERSDKKPAAGRRRVADPGTDDSRSRPSTSAKCASGAGAPSSACGACACSS
jgi:hypothetical protein